MTDFITKFITKMVNAGINPKSTADITPSDRFRRVSCESDKRGKKSLSYWLKVEYDFAYGYAKDFKTGAEVRFNSALDDPGMTRADLARVKALLKARKAQEDIKIAERHEKIAARAKVKWAQAAESGSTPYLDRKGLPLLSARIYGDRNVMVPVYEAGKSGSLDLVSWQMIRADGEKGFPFGGKQSGCFHIIGQIDPTKPILICEGWATGASLHLALEAGIVVALSSGNLLPVAKSIRSIYTATPIIIAGDNDESGAGQKAAAAVQKSVPDVSIVIPENIGKDFNDLPPDAIKKAFGREGAGGAVTDIVPEDDLQSPEASPSDSNWMANVITDSKNRIVATSLQNAILYLLYHQDFEGCFAFDEFKQAVLVRKCPPWQDPSTFKVDRITDIQITQAAATLERYGLTSTVEKTAKAIQVAANENRFHSARQYFAALEWDGVPRLETFLTDHIGCKVEAPAYLAFVFKKWMTAAVKRIMEPGCKFDHVLILESQKQGLYKSELLKCLATFNGETYHTDSVSASEISNKDTILKMQGNMIVELAELTGFSKQDDNLIKNWITQTIDEVRLPYSRETSRFFRQFVFAATTNNYDYLKDPTGNRRYWPVTIEDWINVELIEKIKGQLWAEAVSLYKSGLYIGPTKEENELAEIERQKRMQSDAWEETILNIIARINMDEFRIGDILAKMELRMNEKNEKAIKRIATILKANGYSTRSAWNAADKKSVRLWGKYDA